MFQGYSSISNDDLLIFMQNYKLHSPESRHAFAIMQTWIYCCFTWHHKFMGYHIMFFCVFLDGESHFRANIFVLYGTLAKIYFSEMVVIFCTMTTVFCGVSCRVAKINRVKGKLLWPTTALCTVLIIVSHINKLSWAKLTYYSHFFVTISI